MESGCALTPSGVCRPACDNCAKIFAPPRFVDAANFFTAVMQLCSSRTKFPACSKWSRSTGVLPVNKSDAPLSPQRENKLMCASLGLLNSSANASDIADLTIRFLRTAPQGIRSGLLMSFSAVIPTLKQKPSKFKNRRAASYSCTVKTALPLAMATIRKQKTINKYQRQVGQPRPSQREHGRPSWHFGHLRSPIFEPFTP